jgi:uncharacterized protein YjiS (DUF1127 family)
LGGLENPESRVTRRPLLDTWAVSRQLCFHYLLGALVKNPSNWLHLRDSASQLRELDDHLLSAVNLANLNSLLFSYRVVLGWLDQ